MIEFLQNNVDIVLDFLKKKLPKPVGAQSDAILGGKGDYGLRSRPGGRFAGWNLQKKEEIM